MELVNFIGKVIVAALIIGAIICLINLVMYLI